MLLYYDMNMYVLCASPVFVFTLGLHSVTLVQKLRKSFFGEIEFFAPSCSSGSALMPDTLFEKIYRRVCELCPNF